MEAPFNTVSERRTVGAMLWADEKHFPMFSRKHREVFAKTFRSLRQNI